MIPTLNTDQFNDRFGAYLESSPVTDESAQFEAALETEAYERLLQDWQGGWDFETRTDLFGGRGTSILIQNAQIDWLGFWEWLRERAASIPQGALINFEVYDSIKDGITFSGPMLLRRVVTGSGTFDEENEQADDPTA